MLRFLAAAALALALGFLTWKWASSPPQPEAPARGMEQQVSPPSAETASVPAAAATPVATATASTAAPGSGTAAPSITPPAQDRKLQEFSERVNAVDASLPKLSQLRALEPGEVHGTPQAVVDAGAAIGDVADAIEKDPKLAPVGLAFYARCAQRADLSTPVRALCLADHRELAKKASATPLNEQGIAASVVRLADKLKENR